MDLRDAELYDIFLRDAYENWTRYPDSHSRRVLHEDFEWVMHGLMDGVLDISTASPYLVRLIPSRYFDQNVGVLEKYVRLEEDLVFDRALGKKDHLLIKCVDSGLLHSTEFLLKRGLSPNITYDHPDQTQEACLHRAVFRNNHAMVALLLKYGAKLECSAGYPDGNNAGLALLWNGDQKMLQLLLFAGLDPLAPQIAYMPTEGNTFLETAFLYAATAESSSLRREIPALTSYGNTTPYRTYWPRPVRRSNFRHRLEFVESFLRYGCPDMSSAVVTVAFYRHAYLTLVETLKLHVLLGRILIWPNSIPAVFMSEALIWEYPVPVPLSALSSPAIVPARAHLLKNWIERIDTSSFHPSNAATRPVNAVVLRHLKQIVRHRPWTAVHHRVPSLVDLCINTFRSCCGVAPSLLAWKLGAEFPVAAPLDLKRRIACVDLQERLEVALNGMYEHPVAS